MSKKRNKFGWDDVGLMAVTALAVGVGSYVVFGKLGLGKGEAEGGGGGGWWPSDTGVEGEGAEAYQEPWPDRGNGDGFNTEQVPTNVDTEGQEPNLPFELPEGYTRYDYPEESYTGAKGYSGFDIGGGPGPEILYLETEFQEVPFVGGSDSWYERLDIYERFGWTPAEYQRRWLEIQGETFGGIGPGKVMGYEESQETGLPMMTVEELVAFNYYPDIETAQRFLANEAKKAAGGGLTLATHITYPEPSESGGGGSYDYSEPSEEPGSLYSQIESLKAQGMSTSEALRELYK